MSSSHLTRTNRKLTSSAITEKRRPPPLARTRTSTSFSSDSSLESLKVPRTPRFAEATTVYSPIDPPDSSQSPFADPPGTKHKTQSHMAQSQPSDIGFGYISQNDSSRHDQGVPVEIPQTPGSPLKSAMRIPGTPGRKIDNPLSPTFREEQILEKHEDMTDKEQAKDLVCFNYNSFSIKDANIVLENKNTSTNSKVPASRSELQL